MKKYEQGFDERQRAIRGECYMHSLWLLIVLICLNAFTNIRWTELPELSYLAICVFVLVFSSFEMLLRDVAFDLKGRYKWEVGFGAVVSPLLIIFAFYFRAKGQTFLADGVLSANGVCFAAALMLFALSILALIKMRVRKKSAE
ncbi:MAG: hypothetical protein LBM98_05775 [Oscillospiraceae bacterium]|jgi:hypothetical protein|nr:hypothetical protein [Oscillospiraceae bacterium]